LVFNKGSFIDRMFTADLHEILTRFLVILIILLFSIYVQLLVNKLFYSQREIKLAYKKLNQIFNTEVDGIRVIDKDFNMLLMNEKFSILSGVRKDEAVGKKCYEVFRGQSCHTSRCPLMRILSGEEHIEYDVEKVRKDGTIVLCILTAVPFLGINGEIIGIVEDFKDITERERIRRDLRESEKKFRDLANLLPQTVFEIDPDGKITYFNKCGFDSFGCTRKDIDNGLNILQMFIPGNREKVKQNIRKRLSGIEIGNN
jgi:PAS domain S-box-containing protein